MLKEREAWLEKERAEHQLKIKETEQHESTIRARLAELRHAQHLSATEMLHSLPLVFLSIQSPAAINSVVDKEFQRHVDFTAVLLVAIAGIWIFYVTFK
jgi:cyanate permease